LNKKKSPVPPQYDHRRIKGEKIRIDRIKVRIQDQLQALDKALAEAKRKEESGELEDILQKAPRQYRRKYRKLFSPTLETVQPLHSQWDHCIDLMDGKTTKFFPIYNLNEVELKTLREWITEQLEKGYIRPSTSPAGYPVMFVPKKNGKLRLVIDYRQLNEITIKDRTPLPLITEIRDRLTGANWFTALDLKGAYNLIRIREGDEWKTAFRTRYGLFECLVMPFGLTNAPATFQRMINHVLRAYIDDFVIVYLDDILIFSKTLEEHEEHVHKVLQTLQDANLLVELEKCSFHVQEVKFLGHLISPGQVRMDPDKLKAIRDWEFPETRKGMQSFLGLANYYRRFIRNYSKIAKPLTDATRLEEDEKGKKKPKDRKLTYKPEMKEAFEQLKNALLSEPVLIMYDPNKPLEIETDSSDFAIGGVLIQKDENGKNHPVAFFSRKLHGPELRYPIYDKEFMAILEAFKEWRHYCLGSKYKVKVHTDHRNIVYFTKTQKLSARQTRYFETLSDFDYELVHCEGTANGRADALSRKEEHFEQIPEFEAQILRKNHEGNYEQIRVDTLFVVEENHHVLDKIKDEVKNWTPDQFPEEVTMENDLPVWDGKVWVPEKLQDEAIRDIHQSMVAAAHRGIKTTYKICRRYYRFVGLKSKVTNIVSKCSICQRAKSSRHKPYGLLQPLPVPQRPWESISFDLITKLPPSKEPMTKVWYDSILVVVDRFTKMAYFIPFKESHTAEDLAYVVLRVVSSAHGTPGDMVSDRGNTFVAKFTNALNARLGTNHKISTAYHKETDGQTERINQIIETMLRCYINFEQNNWVELLPVMQLAYNSAPSESTGKSPFFLNYGFEPEAYRPPRQGEDVEKAIIKAENMIEVHNELREQLEFVRERMSKYADRHRLGGPNLQEGDMVWLLRHTRGNKQANIKTNRPSDKLDFKKLGPYKILRKIGEVNYELELPERQEKRGKYMHPIFHISLLEKAQVDENTGEIIQDEIIIEGEEEEYEVKGIDAMKIGEKGERRYRVQWEKGDEEEETWEPIENLENAMALVEKLHQTLGIAPTQDPRPMAPEDPHPPKKKRGRPRKNPLPTAL
jgi:hypothetical protein